MDKTKLFFQVKKDIENFSKKYSRLSGIEFDELVCEGNLFFCELVEKFEESNGNFENYFRKSLCGFYKDLIEKENKVSFVDSDVLEFLPAKISEVEETEFTEKTKELLKDVFNPKFDFLKLELQNLKKSKDKQNRVTKKTLTQKILFQHLKKKGWRNSEIDFCFNEIKSVLV
jgi:hypothetical protein